MNILITAAQGETFQRHFPAPILEQLRALGTVVCNPFPRPFTAQELAEALKDTDIVITHWGTPQIDACMLDGAPRLRLLAHAAGTVAHIASEAFYERNIPVLSANSVMARFVAESVLGYMIAATHRVAQLNASIRAGSWDKRLGEQTSLFGNSIGLIGLGTVGRELLSLLAPFGCAVRVYDPYLPAGALERWPFAAQCGFEEAMRQPIVSVHASQTPETYHMIDANALELLPEGGILLNTARGSLVDTQALIAALQTQRIYAVLDVYEEEGADNQPEALLQCQENTLLLPHIAAAPATWQLTQAVVDDIGCFLHGEPLTLAVSLRQYRLMTQE